MTTAGQQTVNTQESAKVRAAWDNIAAAYDDFTTPNNMRLAEEVLRLARLRPNLRFLDVAAGSGALSIPAARLGAQVVAVDFSPPMIERLLARARKEDLPNLEGRVMDGHALELEDGSFDVAGSQFGVMLFPDLPRALRELVRVTRSGGRVVLVAFGPPTRAEFLTFFLGALKAVLPGFSGLPTDPPPLPFQVADPRVLRQRLADAGLREIQIETIDHRLEFESGGHLWDLVTSSNPIGAGLVAGLTADQRDEVKQVLDGMLRERSMGGPAILHNEVNIGIGTK